MARIEEIMKLYKYTSDVFINEEDFFAYRPGGYHPVTLGDTLKNNRYKIVHKLGYGGFSTVWLAKDRRHKQWVSIKIAKADRLHQFRELQSLQSLAKASTSSLAFEHIVELRDDFVHKGPNGSHQCLVFELLGPTLETEIKREKSAEMRIDPDTVIRISIQILKALTFMHKAGYAHGDLSPKNVAFWSPHLSRLSEEKLLEVLEEPLPDEVIPLNRNPLPTGIPTEVVESAEWPGWPLDEDKHADKNIRLIDLGEAFHCRNIPQKLAQPWGLQAPQMFFGDKFDYRQDLWRAGSIVFYLVFRSLPCSGWSKMSLISSMIMVFEELPSQWERQWLQILEEHKTQAVAKDDTEVWRTNRKHRLEKLFDKEVSEPKLKRLLQVIEGLCRLLPENRIPASEALAMIQNIKKTRE